MIVDNGASTSSPRAVEWLSAGVSREWLFDKKVAVYTVLNASRESVDTWAETCKTDINNWPANQPVLLMHDLSAKGIALTPYARERSQAIAATRPESRGRIAVVLSSSLAASLIQLFLRTEKRTPRIHRAFSSREKGLAWLLIE